MHVVNEKYTTDGQLQVETAAVAQVEVGALSPTPTYATSENLTFNRAVRLYPKVAGFCVAFASGIIMYGYDLVIVGTITALPAFQ